ncbi:nuclear transport factor 2 family protein [Sphingobacterium bovistauri]|uniref:Lumazine-binding n=1 Tax=Sphingobacterium bovistauri TaxID=2781959 RepID=A0ABS7Z3A2_9SPHI|nr:nuclear transport factor 2 family protein [Sphingobacterium bovistauri]MCA5004665.1 hypothetical protein [Sphingobacterium bovistauri]
MKKTLSTIATALLMIISLSSFANPVINPLKEKDSKTIVFTYVEAIALGSDVYNKYLFADDFEYRNTANSHTFNKKQYLKFLNDTKGLSFNCETNYQILDETGKSCVAKAIMTFANFTRVDYITMVKTLDGWKVSKVVTTYP